MEIADRRPSGGAVLAVDFADQRFDIDLQAFVFGDFFAAWNDDLQHRDTALPFLVRLQKYSKCRQPLEDSFRIVETIDA